MSGVRLIVAGLYIGFVLTAIRADDGIERAMAATVRIDGGKSSGTGFFVRTEKSILLVTAAHVLEEATGAECKVNIPVKREDGSYAPRETTFKVREGDKPLWRKHADLDVAVLPVEIAADLPMVPFLLAQVADEAAVESRRVRVAQEVWIPCFPARLASNEAGWPILRRGTIASHPLSPIKAAKTFMVDTSAFGGDSGAPVIVHPDAAQPSSQTPPLVVGLVTGMHRQTDKATLPFEERTMHTPLGVSIVIHAQFIREIVDAAGE